MPFWQFSRVHTEVHFASFFSVGFTTMTVINPPERKLAKRTSVEWVNAAQVIMNKALEDLDAFLEVKEASARVADALVATNQVAMNQAGMNQAGEIQQVPVLAQGNMMDVVPHAKSLTG